MSKTHSWDSENTQARAMRVTSTQRRELRAAINDWRTTVRGYARVQAQIAAQRGLVLDFEQDGRGSGLEDLEHELMRRGELRIDY